jgi:hypothetical protein
MATPIWMLSDFGRSITWAEWIAHGGCGVPNWSRFAGPFNMPLTLGEIEDQCPATGRVLARFATDHLGLADVAIPYQNQTSRP